MQPKKIFRVGLVKAAIFEREVQGNNGAFQSHSIALQQSYQKGDEWKNNTLTIVKKNLAKTIHVLQEAAAELGVTVDSPSTSPEEQTYIEEAVKELAMEREAEEALE